MADGEGVMEEVTGGIKAHPWLIVGGVLVGVLAIYLVTAKKAATVQQFTSSSGPSAAAVSANAAITMAQAHDSATSAIASSYFDYLAKSSATAAQVRLDTAGYAAAVAKDTNATQLGIVGSNNYTAMVLAGTAAQTTLGTAAYQAQTAQQQAAYGSQSAIAQANLDAQVKITQANLGAQVGINQADLNYNLATTKANLDAQTALTQIASAERIAANDSGTAYAQFLHSSANVQ